VTRIITRDKHSDPAERRRGEERDGGEGGGKEGEGEGCAWVREKEERSGGRKAEVRIGEEKRSGKKRS